MIARALAPLSATGLDPKDLVRETQKIVFPAEVCLIKSERSLKKALERVAYAKEIDARMAAANPHELIKLHEAIVMLLRAELFVRASLRAPNPAPATIARIIRTGTTMTGCADCMPDADSTASPPSARMPCLWRATPSSRTAITWTTSPSQETEAFPPSGGVGRSHPPGATPAASRRH